MKTTDIASVTNHIDELELYPLTLTSKVTKYQVFVYFGFKT